MNETFIAAQGNAYSLAQEGEKCHLNIVKPLKHQFIFKCMHLS